MNQVDAEDGYCPECGSIIAASAIFMDEEDELEKEIDLDEKKKVEDLDGLNDNY
jgi:hypothetical protein